jgi:hypothetical protein
MGVKKKEIKKIKAAAPAKKAVSAEVPPPVSDAEIAPQAGPNPSPENKYEVGRVLKNTWAYYKNAFWVNFLIMIIPCACVVPFFMKMTALASDKAELTSHMGQFVGYYFVLAFIFWYMIVIMTIIFDSRGLGKDWNRPGITGVLVSSLTGFLRMMVLFLIYFGCFIAAILPFVLIGVLVGQKAAVFVIVPAYLILIVSCIYASLVFGPALVITIIEPKILKALKESAEITKGKRGKILFTYLTAMLIAIAAEFALMIPIGITVFIMARITSGVLITIGVTLLGLIIAMLIPITYAFIYSIYNEAKTTVK